ncbi:hypothetical protein [Bradyrhizobium sp. CB2312]|uniref:hypothetical protein n=1 Tax=Bradyrhizobium sp. CB2312 TaxID=3039155 RepID=UPI0024B207CA|nr:hypothetical protein [Bradyrhizobium sp. CB2312]WFU70630.1 hypothetical protein QA642_36015 [Bradyrhizobium sp. CB2312]
MKIFWSWQSDTPGRIGRHFVRDALKLVIEELKQARDVEEPTAAETCEGIHLDHDRQGVSGSPDLARTIFDKIDRSAVFVADVTSVGTSIDGKKKLIKSFRSFTQLAIGSTPSATTVMLNCCVMPTIHLAGAS